MTFLPLYSPSSKPLLWHDVLPSFTKNTTIEILSMLESDALIESAYR